MSRLSRWVQHLSCAIMDIQTDFKFLLQAERDSLTSLASMSEFPATQNAVLIPSTAELPDQATQAAHQALANPGLIHLRRRLGLPLLDHSMQHQQLQHQPQQHQQQQQLQQPGVPGQPMQQHDGAGNSTERSRQQANVMQHGGGDQSQHQTAAAEQGQPAGDRFQECTAGVSTVQISLEPVSSYVNVTSLVDQQNID